MLSFASPLRCISKEFLVQRWNNLPLWTLCTNKGTSTYGIPPQMKLFFSIYTELLRSRYSRESLQSFANLGFGMNARKSCLVSAQFMYLLKQCWSLPLSFLLQDILRTMQGLILYEPSPLYSFVLSCLATLQHVAAETFGMPFVRLYLGSL